MTDATRYKTIATIAVAFSLGNLFATACGGDGGGLFKNAAANTAALEAKVAALQGEVSDIKCVLIYLEDSNQDGDSSSASDSRYSVDENEVVAANNACGI
jgi:hypothetical protein